LPTGPFAMARSVEFYAGHTEGSRIVHLAARSFLRARRGDGHVPPRETRKKGFSRWRRRWATSRWVLPWVAFGGEHDLGVMEEILRTSCAFRAPNGPQSKCSSQIEPQGQQVLLGHEAT